MFSELDMLTARSLNQPNHPTKWAHTIVVNGVLQNTPYKWPYELSNASYNYNLYP